MSEELIQTEPILIGRYRYYKLGATTLSQLKKANIIRKAKKELKNKKPDGLIVLNNDTKAVVEYKTTKELSSKKKIKNAIEQEIDVAKHLCKLLIVTDGKKTFWINALNGEQITKGGELIPIVFDVKKLYSDRITSEEKEELANIIDEAEHSLTEDNSDISEPEVLDPTFLAKEVWQKIWINTGKEPEKCLYNVVEIFVFKFLSDIGLLKDNNSFSRVIEICENEGPSNALEHYARVSRKTISKMFPKGDDGTSIINGTIFVNEKGEPNTSQATLFGQVINSFRKYEEMNGSFKYVNKEFKTRLYESFLRQSAGVKNLGQYFTPRNVVQAMVRMSNAENLQPGASICDPFCGVGGFILETIFLNENLLKEFEPENGTINPNITIVGYDKGTDEKDDERTIILAKANMLIYFSDLMSRYYSNIYIENFAENVLNKVFYLLRTNLGTFELTNLKPFDLIITNPPYVTSGSGSLKEQIKERNLLEYYEAGGRGAESLALQWIINNLKPSGQALVIVPDGLMNQKNMLDYIKQKCIVNAIISLPIQTFYATPKKTYILILEKKDKKKQQSTPVFTYLVSEIGETRDANRFQMEQNDLIEATRLYKLFASGYTTLPSNRCKVIPFTEIDGYSHWMADRFWSNEEKLEMGIIEERQEVTEEEFYSLIKEIDSYIKEQLGEGLNEN